MKRRSLFTRTVGTLAAAVVAPLVARLTPGYVGITGDREYFRRLTFRGVPLVFDPNAPPNSVYFYDTSRTVVSRVTHQWWRNQ